MKSIFICICILLLHVGIDAKNLNLGQAKSLSFMKIKESIKSLKVGAGGGAGSERLKRCYTRGRSGRYEVPVAYYRSKSNPTVTGNYINVEPYALGNDAALTKTIYKFNCRDPKFSSTGLCQQIAQEKDGSECTKCFGTDKTFMKKEVQMMYGGILSQNDEKRDGNLKITLTIKCRKNRRSGFTMYSYVVEDRPTSRRRRLLAGDRREGQCRL